MASNYQPVSLTCVCCKVMEHILVSHMLRHFDDEIFFFLNNFRQEAGFQRGSLLRNPVDYYSKWSVGISRCGEPCEYSYPELLQVMVSHHRLMSKIDHYGMRGNIHKWILSFLNNINQKVMIAGYSSDTISVDSVLPRGSVLGSILFLVFMNDLPDLVKSQCRLFADDCLLYNEIKTLNDSLQLQKEVKLLENWADERGMKFNAKKCYIISTETGGIPFLYT